MLSFLADRGTIFRVPYLKKLGVVLNENVGSSANNRLTDNAVES